MSLPVTTQTYRMPAAEPVSEECRVCPCSNLPDYGAGCSSRRRKIVAVGRVHGAARLGHLERAIDPALAHQRVHVGLVEENEPRQERELVVRLEQLRSGLLDRVERCFEMRRRLGRSRPCHRHVRKPGVRRPAHARIRRTSPSAFSNKLAAFVQPAASSRNLRRVQGVEHEVAGMARFLQRLRLIVEARRCVPARRDRCWRRPGCPPTAQRPPAGSLPSRPTAPDAGRAAPRVDRPSKSACCPRRPATARSPPGAPVRCGG